MAFYYKRAPVCQAEKPEKRLTDIGAKFAVIDTETNFNDEVMSIGLTVADSETLTVYAERYYIISPEYKTGGMFSDTLFTSEGEILTRPSAIASIKALLREAGVSSLFAYNASFDRRHLPELAAYNWHDIMRIAAYKQYNPRIPNSAPLCKSGKLKSGYSVEAMLRLLGGDELYGETHNALLDARDELRLISLLGHSPKIYPLI